MLLGPFGVHWPKQKGRRMVKSYSVGLELSIASHQHKQLNVVKCSAAPQLRNPIRTKRSGEAVKKSSIPHDLEL